MKNPDAIKFSLFLVSRIQDTTYTYFHSFESPTLFLFPEMTLVDSIYGLLTTVFLIKLKKCTISKPPPGQHLGKGYLC